jgi:hypothetical protein
MMTGGSSVVRPRGQRRYVRPALLDAGRAYLLENTMRSIGAAGERVRVHVFQHVPFEGLGSIRPWLEEHRADVSHTRFYANETPPPLDGIDLLIALGGPMSVNDEAERPWLKGEKQAVRDAIARDVPVLGICLGAHMIASALGARVYRIKRLTTSRTQFPRVRFLYCLRYCLL